MKHSENCICKDGWICPECFRVIETELENETALKLEYRNRAWSAESSLSVRYGLRDELCKLLGIEDGYGESAFLEAIDAIKRLKRNYKRRRL